MGNGREREVLYEKAYKAKLFALEIFYADTRPQKQAKTWDMKNEHRNPSLEVSDQDWKGRREERRENKEGGGVERKVGGGNQVDGKSKERG